MLGANDWRPQPINIEAELERLSAIAGERLDDPSFINKSIIASRQWFHSESFTHSWFECGERVDDIVNEINNLHHESAESLDNMMIEQLMSPIIDSWKYKILITCMWMRSKTVNPKWIDLVVVLHQIKNEDSLSKVDFIKAIASRSFASSSNRFFLSELREVAEANFQD
ncbi:hypothetical protein PsalMR5_01182 [Piscirickettsia salmonis]|uniref:hypothetical protein n=1 Tax=Piscirickettsia salmonis TaxID=1238 RepID=UPI0012BA5E99|nr:hypothetical protein [Piscirickettsia salmonis]QGP63327.1 hypothetical protein PsalMR5_01182 [Piscirickettsia salmonis]